MSEHTDEYITFLETQMAKSKTGHCPNCDAAIRPLHCCVCEGCDGCREVAPTTPPAAPVVARELYSELIHIAAELVKGEGFLSPCADDHSARTPRGVIAAAQYQDSALKDWANRIRQVADKLSVAAPAPEPPQLTEEESQLIIGAIPLQALPEMPDDDDLPVCLKCKHFEHLDPRGHCTSTYRDAGGSIVYCGCKCEFAAPVAGTGGDEGERTSCASCKHPFCMECNELDVCCKCNTEIPPRTVAERLAQHEHIDIVPGVLGGVNPLVSRTRISVHHILSFLYHGRSIEEIAEIYHLTPEGVRDAITFAQDVYDDAIDAALRSVEGEE